MIEQISHTPEELTLRLSKGHLEAVNDILQRFSFKDPECLFRFLIAVMYASATTAISVINKNGETVNFTPSDYLVEDEEFQAPT